MGYGYSGGLQGITISWNHFKAPNIKAILIGVQQIVHLKAPEGLAFIITGSTVLVQEIRVVHGNAKCLHPCLEQLCLCVESEDGHG